jgi:hypothetical protein
MLASEEEKLLVVKQLRRAREEVLRAKLMLEAIATRHDADSIGALHQMVEDLGAFVDAIVKARVAEEPSEE